MIQGSEEWFNARLGFATASCFSDVQAKGQGKTRKTYLNRVVAERLTGKPLDSFSNHHTERGTEQEPYARMAYEVATGNICQEVGFIRHATLMAGSSPDCLIEVNGGAEIKCVIPTVQIETIERGGYPAYHKAQVQGNLWITGREWWDFVSYSPNIKFEHLRLYIFRVHRDEEYIKNLEKEVTQFLIEADELYERLARRVA